MKTLNVEFAFQILCFYFCVVDQEVEETGRGTVSTCASVIRILKKKIIEKKKLKNVYVFIRTKRPSKLQTVYVIKLTKSQSLYLSNVVLGQIRLV
jgi:hypothetical protein